MAGLFTFDQFLPDQGMYNTGGCALVDSQFPVNIRHLEAALLINSIYNEKLIESDIGTEDRILPAASGCSAEFRYQ